MKPKLLSEPDCAKYCGVPLTVLRDHRKAGHLRPARYRLVPWRNGISRLAAYYDPMLAAAFFASVQAHQEEKRLIHRGEIPLPDPDPVKYSVEIAR